MNSDMEAARIQGYSDTQVGLRDEIIETSNPVDAASVVHISTSTMKEDVAPEGGPLDWQQSPIRTTLLPPFGMGHTSHLPTPLSPRHLDGYLAGPSASPLSSDASHAGPSRHFATFRPPSRPASVHPPTTPQRDPFTSTSKFPSRSIPPPFRTDPTNTGGASDPPWPQASQIATPSPEISRIRLTSVPNTPSSEPILATPSVGTQRSSRSHNGRTALAPAPIISPTNSNYPAIYHASLEFESERQGSPSFNFSHSSATIVPDNHQRRTTRSQGTRELADPFIVQDDATRNVGSNGYHYPSPSIARKLQHCSTHVNSHSPVSQVHAASPKKSAMAMLIMSPSEYSEPSSHYSPVKTEIEDEDDIVACTPLVPDSQTPTQPPPLPRTPPRESSAREPEGVLRTLAADQSIFRTPSGVAGGEIERIRQRQVDLMDARILESERRRPDYLVRAKHARDDSDDEVGRENAASGLGVTVSPVQGRRLKLYRPVPMPGLAVPGEDNRPEIDDGELKTPPLNALMSASIPSMSLRTINWCSPTQRHTSPTIWTEEGVIKKQRRLAAFAAPEPSERRRRLRPVEVSGQGRVVIDVTSAETRNLAEAGVLDMPPPNPLDDVELHFANGLGAGWPDDEYPWSLQRQQRRDREEAERHQRLRWIERFLDRESESEDDDPEVIADTSTRGPLFGTPSRTRCGRGKSILLTNMPGSRRTAVNKRVFAAANADAREALLSKKHVRAVAERLRRRKVAEEDEGVVMCICQGGDDGRPMVRCDECRTWYHLVCMDIRDESELGDEWFCWKCVPSAEDQPPAFEPTFAPVMPDTPPRTSVGDLPLYQTALQPSPMLDIRTRAPISPLVPTHFNRDSEPSTSPPRRSRLPHILGDPCDPVRGGPSTPYHSRSTDSRLYSTPKYYDDHTGDEYPFDPTSTPSRGIKFTNVPITPRRPHTWTEQAPLWATPLALPRTPQFSSQTHSSSARSLAYSLATLEDSGGPLTSPWPSDDLSLRRPHKPSESNFPYPPSRRLLDTPLAARSGGSRQFLPGVEESPVARYMHRIKDKDLCERTSFPTHGPG